MTAKTPSFVNQSVEAAIKIAAIFFLVSWCHQILSPFIAPLVWALIIAIAVKPLCDLLEQKYGLSRKLASITITLSLLALLITPMALLSSTTLEGLREVAAEVEQGQLTINPPKASVKSWPIVGEDLFTLWSEAAISVEDTLKTHQPEIKAGLTYVMKRAASFGTSILLFIIAIIISGFILLKSDNADGFLRRFGQRLAGPRGAEFVDVASNTVRNVTRGILGVAIIQSLLAALGFYIMDMPVPALLALGVLAVAIVQLPAAIVLLPVTIYAFSVADVTSASIFLVWNIVVGLLDNVLKPLLMGQGAKVPTLVIFLGAIGGFISMGLIGLFVGAVIVVLGYEMFLVWLSDAAEEPDMSSESTDNA